MSRFVVIGQKGSAELLLVDTATKTVQTIDKSSIDPAMLEMRAAGTSAIEGIDVAMAVDSQQQTVGRFLFGGAAQ
jgi:hypothetical protein